MSSLLPKPKTSKPPELSDEKVEKERRRQLALQSGGGIASTNPTGGAGVTQSILGSAAGLTGSIV